MMVTRSTCDSQATRSCLVRLDRSWTSIVWAVVSGFVCTVALGSTFRSELFDVPDAKLTLELSAPPELHDAASQAARRVCQAIQQATGESTILPEGQWRIAVDVRMERTRIRTSVKTTRRTPDGTVQEWAGATYWSADEETLWELLQTWIQLAVPLQGRIVRATEDVSEAIVPMLSRWSWMHDVRLAPGSGVLLETRPGGRYRAAVLVTRTGNRIQVRPLDTGDAPESGLVVIPPAGQVKLHVLVVGRDGVPLGGAMVRVLAVNRNGGSALLEERVAGSSGCEFRLPACAPLLIEARFPGLVARTHRVLYLNPDHVQIRLPASPRRALVVARAQRLLDRVLRVQRRRRAILHQIRAAMEAGNPDTVEGLIEQLEAVTPGSAGWEGELLLIKEEAARYGEDIQGLLDELRNALRQATQATDTDRFRQWVAARRRQMRAELLAKRARELTESMQWSELLECYRELAELTGDEVARQRAAYLEEALRERGPEHRVAREWVRSWVPNASLDDLLQNQDLLELTTERLIDAGDALYLLIVQRSLQRWTDAIQEELDRLRQQTNSTTDTAERSRVAERVRELGELADKLAQLLARIAPITRQIPL